jgi:hypothetical protein
MIARDLKRDETTHGVAHDDRFCQTEVIEQTDNRPDVFLKDIVVIGDRLRCPEAGEVHRDHPAMRGQCRHDS